MRRQTTFLTFFTFSSLLVNIETIAQSSASDIARPNNRPVISSPNATALEKFVEFPTANYTGVPDISIPICEASLKGVRLPIAITYHASGIKVDDIASDVGMGWALSAGGIINIIRNGLIDELSGFPLADPTNYQKIKSFNLQSSYLGGQISCGNAFMYADPYPIGPDPYFLYSGGDISFLSNVVRNQADAEPDLYTFSFLGRTGKFFQDETGIFRTIPYSELRIARIIENNLPAGYLVTDENGTAFHFKVREEAVQTSVNLCSSYDPVISNTRSYYLSKVTTVNSDSILFYYSTYSLSYALQKQFARAKFSNQVSCGQLNNHESYYYHCQTNNSIQSGAQRLDSIKISNGTLVKFTYSTTKRTDVGGQAFPLASIEVWDYLFERKKIKNFTLNQTYFDGRLFLYSIRGTGLPATLFTYNSQALPPRLSYAQDHYGYYNGRENNSTLLPMDEYNGFFDGSNRAVDSIYTQARLLSKITHPTGGTTEFVYEPNRFLTTIVNYNKVFSPTAISQPNQTTSKTFTIPSTATKIKITHTNSYDGTTLHNDYCIIRLTGPNNYSRTFIGNSTSNQDQLNLAPGSYTLSIENVGSTYQAEAYLFWFEASAPQLRNEVGGGVRIKEIKKFDGNSQLSLQKKFEYVISGTVNSSGISTHFPVYLEYRDEEINKQGQNSCSSTYCQFLAQSSSCIAPLFFANGSSVLYSEVTTFIKAKSENGYSSYKYITNNDGVNNSIPTFPYAPPVPFDWVNGTLLEQNDFVFASGQYKKIRQFKQTFNYVHFNPESAGGVLYTAYGAKIAPWKSPFVCWTPCNHNPISAIVSGTSFGIQRFQLYSSWHRLNKTEETNWDSSGTNQLVRITDYFYDNPNSIQPSRLETISSKGEKFVQKMRYAKDYNATGFIQTMLLKNIVATPIEKYVYKRDNANNEFVLSGEINAFKNNTVLLDKVYAFESATPVAHSDFLPSLMNTSGLFSMDSRYKEKLNLISYDVKGNITEFYKAADIKYSYLWDYALVHPVAEVINASLTGVAYTSFETEGNGNWSGINFSNIKSFGGLTGNKFYSQSGFSLSKSGLSSSTAYTITYWSKNGAYAVNGTIGLAGRAHNGWTFYEHQVNNPANGIIIVAGSGAIDELRLYPRGAQMNTYTYEPLIGMSSHCDVNNRITYYQYDAFNRLFLIRDQDGNILKKFCYNYAGQAENCTVSTVPLWQNTATAVRCKKNTSNQNTGEQEQEQVDSNPYSTSYGQARWVVTGTNTTACPLPNTCNQSTCQAQGQAYKCVNGICEMGFKVFTSSTYDAWLGGYVCVYHYEWSDGSWSQDYTQFSGPFACGVNGEGQ